MIPGGGGGGSFFHLSSSYFWVCLTSCTIKGHLGGAVVGLATGLAIEGMKINGEGGRGALAGLPGGIVDAAKRLNNVTLGCMAYLIFRCADDFLKIKQA